MRQASTRGSRALRRWALGLGVVLLGAAGTVHAEAPGRGITAAFEVDFLKSIIDHHFSALRMSELAAGTDPTRDAPISNPAEGTANTPGYAATPAKAQDDAIKSMARQENRAQREEIATAQRFLKEWYGARHEPSPTAMGRRQIQLLETVRASAEFDHLFLETMSRHHYVATTMANECLVSIDLSHQDLQRYCSNVHHMQVNAINDMRSMLCERFQVCDHQPLRGVKGRHSGSRGELGGDDND